MTHKDFTSGLLIFLFVFSIQFDVSGQIPKVPNPDPFIVPFHLIARLVVVEAAVDGQKGWFIIDTGSEELVLNAAHFRRRRRSHAIRGLGGHSVKVKTGYFAFALGRIQLRKKRAFLVDLRHLERNWNIEILGVIGYSILKEYEMMLDYANKKLTFFPLDKKGNHLSGSYAGPEPTHVLPLKLRNHLPCAEVTVGRESFLVALDTGAGINVMDEEVRKKIPFRYSDSRQVNVSSFGKESSRSAVALVEGAQIADMVFPTMRTLFKSLAPLNKQINGRKIDGLFGFEFLYPYKTAFNFRKGAFSIWSGYARERLMTTSEAEELNKISKTN